MAAFSFDIVMEQVRNLESIKDILADLLVIDCHAHIGPHSRYFVPNDRIDGIIAAMDSIGVDKVGINALSALEGEVVDGNTATARAMMQYPDRIIGHCCINPNYPETVESETLRCFEQFGMRMLKFHSAWHKTPPEHARYRPAVEYCAARRIPLLTHLTDYIAGLPGYASLAREYPQMPFIIAHATAPNAIDAIIEVCAGVENMFFDTTGYPKYNRSIERLVEGCGEDRVLFGSDIAWLNLAHEIGPILFAEISDTAKEKLLGRNFQAILEGITP